MMLRTASYVQNVPTIEILSRSLLKGHYASIVNRRDRYSSLHLRRRALSASSVWLFFENAILRARMAHCVVDLGAYSIYVYSSRISVAEENDRKSGR